MFLLLGLLLSFSARAEWIMYGDNGKAEFFYDKKTIIKNGKFVSVMEMLNYSFPLRGVLCDACGGSITGGNCTGKMKNKK
jgi:archaellum component FlaF (FlaF/FlaG flagellin family)